MKIDKLRIEKRGSRCIISGQFVVAVADSWETAMALATGKQRAAVQYYLYYRA